MAITYALTYFYAVTRKNSYQKCEKQTVSYKVYFYNGIYLSESDEKYAAAMADTGGMGKIPGVDTHCDSQVQPLMT